MRSFFAGGDDSLEDDVALVINAASHSNRIYAKQPIGTHSIHITNSPFGDFGHALLPLNKIF